MNHEPMSKYLDCVRPDRASTKLEAKIAAMSEAEREGLAILVDALLAGAEKETVNDFLDKCAADSEWLNWMDSRHMSDWTAEEMQRYAELTGQKGAV